MPTKLWSIVISLLFCTGLGTALTLAFLTVQFNKAESTPQPVSLQPTPTPPQFQPLLDEISTQMQQQQVPGIAVAIVQNGTVTFQQGIGVRNTETHDPVTPQTLFRIGSTTKLLTVIGLMRLVEAGQVDLDAPVTRYLPEFQVNDAITVRQLVSHTSGLADFAERDGRTDATALRDAIATLTPQGTIALPGKVLSYSNPGFNVAGRIIEVVSEQSYTDYMQEFVFTPLGMTRTTLKPTVALTYPLAVGYQPGAQELEAVRPTPDNAAEYPAGFVFSSVEDLSRLLLLLLQEGQPGEQTVLSAASLQAMKTPVLRNIPMNVGYGMGLFVVEENGITSIGHGGNIHGYTAVLETFPEQEFGIVILANKSGFDPTAILTVVKHSLLNLPEPASPPPLQLDASSLQAYTGRYRLMNARGTNPETIAIIVENGQLKGRVEGHPDALLNPVRPDTFQMKIAETDVGEVTFLRDEAGQVAFFSQGLRAYPKLNP